MQGRIAVRTAIALFVSLNLAGVAVVVVAARTTTNQVEGVLRAVVASIGIDPAGTSDPAFLCENASTQPGVAVPGVTAVVIEVRGPHGEVCRRPDAPSLDALVRSSAPVRWATGTDLPRAVRPDGVSMLVLEQPLAGGWTVRFGGDLAAFTVLARRLVITLLVVGLLGALAAALVVTGVARNGLRPVRELADAAETIARTQDLSVRIDIAAGSGDGEIDRLAAAFNRMTAALAGARERQSRLVADAGHELRTPLTSLRANLELLVRSELAGRPLPEAHRSGLLTDVASQLEELSHLVDEVAVLAREEPERPRVAVRLDEVAQRAVERARRRGTGHTIEAALTPWSVPDADADALERAVVNLLDNALKFSPPGSVVRVGLAGGELTVDDEGPGVAPEHRVDAFERFWRSDAARALPGSGLGLAIVAETAAAHGGTAALSDAPRGGTRAVLTLPGRPAGPLPPTLPRDHANPG
jgi:two-component system sensor histidine kinase MprB